jgi:hypothetical protein
MITAVILFFLLAAGSAVAGDAIVSDSFTIAAPFERVSKWIESSGDKIRDSVNVKLVEQHGDTLTLRRQNNRGIWQWKQRESVTKVAGRWQYETTLVESIEGGVEKLDGVVEIREDGGKTTVSAKTVAEVDGVSSRDLRFDLLSRARRIKKLMQEELE